MTLPSYSTGTASVADGGTTVTGAGGANWNENNAKRGDTLQIGEFQTIITDVDAGTLIIPPWGGGAQSGASYNIWQTSLDRYAGIEYARSLNRFIEAINEKGYFVFVGPDETEPDPSYGEEGQFALQPSIGKMWVKEPAGWDFVGTFRGFGTPAAYDNGEAYVAFDVVTLDGSSYVCIAPTTGNAPPNATYWAVLAGKGEQGDEGSAATISIGTVTTVAAGSPASVSNSGTSGAAVFDFEIPAGQDGTGDMTAANALSELSAVKPAARANLGATTVGDAVFIAANAAAARTAIGSTTVGDAVFVAASAAAARTAIGVPIGVPDAIIEDQRTSGTHGGTATSGAWQTRVLNTLVRNNGSVVANLTGNQFQLNTGTYYVEWDTPAYLCATHKSRLQNVTDGTTVAYGTSARSPVAADIAQTSSLGCIVFTLAANKAFEIQHQVTTTATTAGFGTATFYGTETYTRVKITKLG